MQIYRNNDINTKLYIEKMTDFFQRLDKFMEYRELNDNKITVETGMSNGLIGKARKRGSLSQENISLILSTYRELDANWLFIGEGEMIKSGINDKHAENSPDVKIVDNSFLLDRYEKMVIENHELKKEIDQLKNKQRMSDDKLPYKENSIELKAAEPKI